VHWAWVLQVEWNEKHITIRHSSRDILYLFASLDIFIDNKYVTWYKIINLRFELLHCWTVLIFTVY
jgi:hypothetical protein